jgi:ergothioneine biosynthesis glutamate--cysteine ligase EgtA
MTAQFSSFPLMHALDAPLVDADAARAHIARRALTPRPIGQVGLELEVHLVDLGRPQRRPDWATVQQLVANAGALPGGSRITAEPGGQLELSTPVCANVGAAVNALRRDRAALDAVLAAEGFGGAAIGADPVRPVEVVNNTGRYAAMARHFAAVGCASSGHAMMAGTAALQVNLNAGPAGDRSARLAHLHAIGPVLLAISACSPMLAGRASGWRSMRQQVWTGIDARRTGPIAGGDPAAAWADYALAAPVMMVRTGEMYDPVPSRVSFASWISGDAKLIRRPTLPDLDYHLTTLFPPVRPRGWIELRYLDAVPQRWWPALAAITVALADDPSVAAAAAEACEPVAAAWESAARDGLANPQLHRAARTCLAAAAAAAPVELRDVVAAYAELVERGRTPGDEIADRIALHGPLAILKEEAHAAR